LNRKEPDDEFAAKNRRSDKRNGKKRNQRDARHAVSFKTVGGRADGIARVVAGAIGDDTGIFRIIFRQIENDFHQVAADIGDFRENAAANSQRARAEGFANRKTDETRPGEFARNKQEDANHAKEFHANEQEADAHAGFERNKKCFERITFERGERGAGIGGRIDADAEPRDTVAAENSQNRSGKNDHNAADGLMLQRGEIINHAQRDKNPERGEKFSLLQQIRFARFPDDMRNVAHQLVHRQRARLFILNDSEQRADDANDEAEI